MKNSIFTFTFLLLILNSMIVNSSEPQNRNLDSVYNLLKSLPKIRIGITRGGGAGHQSAGVTVIERLRDLGYQGPIEVIYDTEETGEKLKMLIPPFGGQKKGLIQKFDNLNLTFIKGGKNFEIPKKLRVATDLQPLGIMGADDVATQPHHLNVKSLLVLEPPGWINKPHLMISHENGQVTIQNLDDIRFLGIKLVLPSVENYNSFITSKLKTSGLNDKEQFLKSLFNARQNLFILPVYSHGVRKSNTQLLILLKALFEVQHGTNRFSNSNIIVLVLNELDAGRLKRLKDSIDSHFNKLSWSGSVNAYRYDEIEILKKMVDFQRVSDKWDQQINLVALGAVPKPLFENLFLNLNLPGIVEGLNSIELLKQTGLPYLPSASFESFHFSRQLYGPDPNPISELGLSGLLKEAASELLGPCDLENICKTTALSEFYRLGIDRSSPLWKVYQEMQYEKGESQDDRETNDQLVQGLLKYLKTQKQ